MIGAIIGDIIGSPYEFDYNNIKTTEFPLFSIKSTPTDDSVMTIAIALGFVDFLKENDGLTRTKEEALKKCLIRRVKQMGIAFSDSGYGGRFRHWLFSNETKPYGSYGNGSAMRVSSAAWLFNSLGDVEYAAEVSAKITHNHPEGIKGAKSVAAAIYLARTGASKDEIKEYISGKYRYDLSLRCDDIRPYYHMNETCQGTVPQAFAAFFEGNSFEEVIRLGVSLGGDSDTLCAIAGSIAEAFYGIPKDIKNEGIKRLNDYGLRGYYAVYLQHIEEMKAEANKIVEKLYSQFDREVIQNEKELPDERIYTIIELLSDRWFFPRWFYEQYGKKDIYWAVSRHMARGNLDPNLFDWTYFDWDSLRRILIQMCIVSGGEFTAYDVPCADFFNQWVKRFKAIYQGKNFRELNYNY